MKFPNRIRAVRNHKGYSREELANLVGITRQSIGLIESGSVCPSTVIALRLSRVLGPSVDQLFWEKETTIQAKFATNGIENMDGPIRAYMGCIRGQIVARPAHIGAVESIAIPVQGVARSLSKRHELTEFNLLQSLDSISKMAFVSGCDLGLGLLANYAQKVSHSYQGVWFNAPNHKALKELEDGITHIAAVHYPADAQHHRVKELSFAYHQYHFAKAELGWILPKGNPKGFRNASDLSNPHFRIINRELGAGARELLDRESDRFGVDTDSITGYTSIAKGHLAVAEAIVNGLADVGIGHSGAAAMFGLTFIPVQAEYCTLIVPKQHLHLEAVQVLLEALHSGVFHTELACFGPYDVAKTGTTIS